MNEIEEVKARVDIVDLVGQYVQLQRSGRTHKGLCPFHGEKTPSFIVSPERQSWHCFGACGTGGDVISFVMRKEGVEFPEALRALAARAGVTLRERQRAPEEERRRQRVHEANEAAARWYHDLLLNSEAGRAAWQYVQGRGVDKATAQTFLLGYSPSAWEAAREHLRERGFSDAELLAAGLLVQGENGLHDRFRGRLMFPIRDARGRFAGFGARALDDTMPKYLNTAQTDVFDKGGMLYALDRAHDGIRREGCAVIVEGYMDAIAAHQAGFDNVVATMGTSLTERQVRLVKRQAGRIVLALDADAAGNEAALRGHDIVEQALREDGGAAVAVVTWRGLVRYQDAAAVDLRVAVLPEGSDPDNVIRNDAEAWRQLIESAPAVIDYRFEAAATRYDLGSPGGRSAAVQELLPLLEPLTDPVLRAHHLQRLSRLSLVREEELSTMLSRKRARPQPRLRPQSAADIPDNETESTARTLVLTRADSRPEAFLTALLLRYPQLREAGLELSPDLLWDSANRAVLETWKRCPDIEMIKESLEDELKPHFMRLVEWRLFPPDDKVREAFADCRARLEERQLRVEKQAMAALVAASEEQLGPSAIVQAAVAELQTEDEPMKEAVVLHRQDMEAGLRLHTRERKGDSGVPVAGQDPDFANDG